MSYVGSHLKKKKETKRSYDSLPLCSSGNEKRRLQNYQHQLAVWEECLCGERVLLFSSEWNLSLYKTAGGGLH